MIGTPGYFSDEMGQILIQKCGIVDLYYNDVYGLKQTLAKDVYNRKSFTQ